MNDILKVLDGEEVTIQYGGEEFMVRKAYGTPHKYIIFNSDNDFAFFDDLFDYIKQAENILNR